MPEYKVELGPEDNARLEAIRRREDCGAAQAFRVALRRYQAAPRARSHAEDSDDIIGPRNYPSPAHGELRGSRKR